MDSGNSGSMQSSSTAGDEEYDSRAESSSLSAFLNNTNNNTNRVPPPQHTTTATTTTLTHVGPFTHVFDPLSNYMDPTQRTSSSNQNQNQILNLDMVWSKVAAARSEPELSGAGLIPCSSSSFPHHNNNNNNNNNQAFLLSQLGPSQSQTQVSVGVGVFSPTLVPENGGNVGCSREPTSSNANVNPARNPKKRSRASRRAPTTVLTTDTTNFRAMVQEFTGIPAPPFTSSPFPRTRLDLFTSSSPILRSSTHLPNGTLDPPTTSTPPAPYLLRPFAHKLQSQPPIPPMLDTLASHHNNSSTNNNFHNPLNMHNPILSLQSMLQPPPKYQQAALELIAPSGADSSHLRMGGLEELGLSHAHVSGHHHNMVQSSSDGALSRVNNNNNNNNLHNNCISGPSSAEWAQAQAQRIDHNDGGVLRSLNYRSNVPDQRVSNGKVNFSGGGASDFHGDKGPECGVAARSEGIVESWINCSSD